MPLPIPFEGREMISPPYTHVERLAGLGLNLPPPPQMIRGIQIAVSERFGKRRDWCLIQRNCRACERHSRHSAATQGTNYFVTHVDLVGPSFEVALVIGIQIRRSDMDPNTSQPCDTYLAVE